MGQSVVKNPRKIMSQQGGGGSTTVEAPFVPSNTPILVGDDFQEVAEKSQGQINDIVTNVTELQNNEYKITYFAEINAATGTITKPTGSTILLDQFAGGVDAYVSTITNGQPTGDFPETAGGVLVDVASFDASGNFVLSGTPSAYPCALIYIVKISAADLSNALISNRLDLEDINIVKATQATVDTGTNDDQFVTSKTFNDSAQLAAKANATDIADLDFLTVNTLRSMYGY